MSKQREALELALEALEDYQANGAPFFKCDSAVSAIREALAEPEQEPTTDGELYAAFLMGLQSKKPASKPLTDEEIMKTAKETQSAEPGRDGYILPFAFARAIERAHGIGSEE